MNSEERLRHFADNLEQYGPDISRWGGRTFVIAQLHEAADALATATKQVEALKGPTEAPSCTGSAMAGMAWEHIAASAYKAYAASTGNKNYQGLPMPNWADLTLAIQTAWEAAARQVDACIAIVGNGVPPDEQFWAGWVPPHMKEKLNA